MSLPSPSLHTSADGATIDLRDDGTVIDLTIAEREQLNEGLARVTRSQFERVVRLLVGMGDDRSAGELLTTLERLRAVLRLVSSELGAEAYAAEDAVLVEAATLLAPLDRGRSAVATLTALRQRHANQLRADVFGSTITALDDRWRRVQRAATAEPADLHRAVHLLRRAQARYAAWPVAGDEPGTTYGRRPIPHDFAAIEPGLAETYRAARKRWRKAAATREVVDFHRWQLEVSQLANQLHLLAALWPDVVGGMARSLDRLAAVLVEEHDLAELLMTVSADPTLCPDHDERALLFALAQHRRAELHELSIHAGQRLFAEPTKRFCTRMALYWEAWSTPIPDLLALPS